MSNYVLDVVVTLSVTALSLIPLIKGSMILPVMAALLIASYIMMRRKHWEGAFLVPFFVIVFVFNWKASGQSASSLVIFLERQSEIADGYTDAMSLFSDPAQVYAYLISGALLVFSLLMGRRRFSTLEAAVFALVLFVAFKAGFVRHDGHAVIGATCIFLVGFLGFIAYPKWGSALAFVVAISTWIFITSAFEPVDLRADASRMSSAIEQNISAITNGEANINRFRREFDKAKMNIVAETKFPSTSGTVDMYGVNQAQLLASNFDYDPRPLIQSYVAFTPKLAELDKAHLHGARAPESVLFSVNPIDSRYPSLDDGLSWPDLLGLYQFKKSTDQFAVLSRRPMAQAASIGPPILRQVLRFDDALSIPASEYPIWASFKFHPTLLGRIISKLWKLPILTIDVVYDDNRLSHYRLIASMTESGFLLSPTINAADDFVELWSSKREALKSQEIKSITIHQVSEHHWWGKALDVTLAPIIIPADANVDVMTKPFTSKEMTYAQPLVPGISVAQRFEATGNLASVSFQAVTWAKNPSAYRVDWTIVRDAANSDVRLGSGTIHAENISDWKQIKLPLSPGDVKKGDELTLSFTTPGPPPSAPIGLPVYRRKADSENPSAEVDGQVIPTGGQLGLHFETE